MGNPRQAPSEQPLWPRAEARPLLWRELTSAQRDVGSQILRLLQGMAHRDIVSDQSDLDRSLLQLERLRHNRVLLIEGSRGSGKTALLVTILRALQRDAEVLLKWPGTEIEPDPVWNTEARPNLADVLIVPVALIDLAPLPHRSNLLLLFVACLQRVVQRIEEKAGLPPAQTLSAWQPEASEQLPSRVAWERLASAIVQGWDGATSHPGRVGDLESYARETLIGEEQRLELPNCIREFLRALSDDFRRYFLRTGRRGDGLSEDKPLLFLLAVDDADMNPRRVSSLVDALRLFAHQRLAFVLTGDSQLFARNLEYSSVAEQLSNLGPGKLPKEQEAELWQSSQLLARQIYDKLIPTSQRRSVQRLPAAARLSFKLQGERAKGDSADSQKSEGSTQSLADLLQQIAFVPQVSLARLFADMPWLAAALPGHLRALIDFMHLLREPQQEEGSAGPSDSTRRVAWLRKVPEFLWNVAMVESSALNSASASEVGSLRRLSGDHALRVDVRTLPQQLGWIPETGSAGCLRTDWQTHASLQVRARFDRIEPGPQATTHEHWDAVAALLLSALLAEAQGTGQVRSARQATAHVTLPLAAGELQDSRASVNTGEPLRIPWPLPQQLPLVPQLILAFHWASCLAQEKAELSKSEGGNSPDQAAQRRLLSRFVYAVCQQAAYDEDGRSNTSLFASPTSEYGKALAALTGLLQSRSGEASSIDRTFRDWALHEVGLLAAPESGLAPELANTFLYDLRQKIGEDEWLQARRRLAKSREDRLVRVLSHGPHSPPESDKPTAQASALKNRLDKHAQGYDWRLVVEHGAEDLLAELAARCGTRLAPQTLELLLHGSATWIRTLEESLAKNEPDSLAKVQKAAGQPEAHDRPVSGDELRRATEALDRERDVGNFDLVSREGTGARALAATPSLLKDSADARYTASEREIVFRQIPGPLFPCRISRVRTPMFAVGSAVLPPLLRGLWHLQHDERWFRRPGPTFQRVVPASHFPGVAMPVDVSGNLVALPWPTLRWPTFASAGRLAVHWNQALVQLAEQVAEAAGRPLLDAIGFFYIQLSLALAQGREELPKLTVRPLLGNDWLFLLNEMELAHFPSDATESRASSGEGIPLDELWAFLAIMASPETGLSTVAVRAILTWFRDRDSDDSRHKAAFAEREQRFRTFATLRSGGADGSQFVSDLRSRITSAARELGHPTQLLIDTLPRA